LHLWSAPLMQGIMLEVLEQLVENETIPSAVADKLKSLTPGTVCQHKSWGIGRIQSWDVEGGRLVVDFPGKSGHLLEFGFAALSLKPFAA
jgi:transcription elongation factor GreA-like protein